MNKDVKRRGRPPKKKTKSVEVDKTKYVEQKITDEFTKELLDVLNEDSKLHPTQTLGGLGYSIGLDRVISTQCPSIDLAIGRGGIPMSRTSVIHGPEASGKTTLSLHLIAETMRRGGMCIYIDAEGKLDPDYAKSIGVPIDRLVVSQPPYIERSFIIMDKTVDIANKHKYDGKNFPVLLVVDSINALQTKSQYEADYEAQDVAAEARVWSKLIKKFNQKLFNSNVALLLISQERTKIGVLFGKNHNTGGGNAPKYYASVMMRVTKIKNDPDSGLTTTRVKLEKNQIAPPFKTADFNIVYGRGIDYEESLLREAVEAGHIESKGSWFDYNSEKIGQGSKNASGWLRENPDVCNDIAEKLGLYKRYV